jgi:uncharacterized protein YdeI (YjbR/CyaY-like superfamily)
MHAMVPKIELEELLVPDVRAWRTWLDAHHTDSPGVWLVLHKKGGAVTTLTYDEALDDALCYGWIDGQVKRRDDGSYLQRMTPRRKASRWSSRNVEHIDRLIREGRMHAAGLREVERAKDNGEWHRAYDGSATAAFPDDLQAAIDANPSAQATFERMNRANRYALIHRVNNPKTPAGRERAIVRLVDMLADGKMPYPQA